MSVDARELLHARARTRRHAVTPIAAHAVRWLDANVFAVVVVCAVAAVLLLLLPSMLGSDSWLLLVAGREVLEAGLPRTDSLTLWTAGRDWVDQQWLAQVLAYGAYLAVGLKGLLVLNVAALVTALSLALAAARRAGASGTAVALVALGIAPLLVPRSGLRAETLVLPLFAALLALLLHDARSPSRRVYLALPVLVLWANLHGSVLVGAALVAAAGATAPGAPRGRRLALVAAPWACVLASPYAAALPGYYRNVLGNDAFAAVVTEWQPVSFPAGLPLFAVLVGGAWLLGRRGEPVLRLETVAFALTGLAALSAARHAVWFALAAAAILPPAAAAAGRRAAAPRRPRANAAIALGALAACAATLAVTAARPAAWHLSAYPPAAARAVAALAAERPAALVLAHERYADWLLLREPQLAGRIAYDARLELLPAERLHALARFRSRSGGDWKAASAGFDVIVLRADERALRAALLREPGAREAYADGEVAVLARRDS